MNTSRIFPRQLARQVGAALAGDRINSLINSGTFVPGRSFRFGSLDFVTNAVGQLVSAATLPEGKAPSFGSLSFVADRFGRLQLHDLAPCRAEEPAPGQPLGSSPPDRHGELASQLVTMVESLSPILDSGSDGYESTGSSNSKAEVFVVQPTTPTNDKAGATWQVLPR